MNEDTKTVIEVWVIIGGLIALCLVFMLMLTSGCVSGAKNAYISIMETPPPTPTPSPAPTPPPTIEPTPAPVPTEDLHQYMLRTNGHPMREFAHWFRADVEGIQPGPKDTGDLSAYASVWGYKFMPSYHWYSVSWARKFLVKPEDKENQFLFFFVNEYLESSSVRAYGYDCSHFQALYNGRFFYPETEDYPERRITEFDEVQNYNRVSSIQPFSYKIVQEAGTGIITAEKQDIIYSGRSNGWDGYCRVEVPWNATAKDIRIYGQFANVGGNHWWQLE